MEGVAHNPAFASKVGIPQHVGKEFVGKDALKATAAGTMFIAPEGRLLLVKRSPVSDHPGEWCLPGGHIDGNETPLEAAKREALEELGVPYYPDGGRFFSRTQSAEGVDFSTFAVSVPGEFVPTLNKEHVEARWFDMDDLPTKLHPGVRASLTPLAPAEDMKPEDWRGLVEGFLKFIAEEEEEPEHVEDELVTTLPSKMVYNAETKKYLDAQAYDGLIALDAKSLRTYTVDGHLLVSRTPISKANVCEYYGREIPNAEGLGLDPNVKYRLLRDPEELAKAASTLNGKPLLITHESSSADDHPRDLTVGSLGTDAEFDEPYLYNSLSIWDGEGIQGVETNRRRQISAGYRYVAVMTPGVYKGAPYDGIMTQIIFNHAALVPAGRAGADIFVGDEKPNGEVIMKIVLSRKALYMAAGVSALLAPRLAQDAKPDLGEIFSGVSAKNFAQKKPTVVAALKAIPLAKDQAIEPVLLALDAMEKEDVPEGADADPSSGLPMNAAEKKAKDEAEAEKAKKDKDAADKKARDSFVENFKKGKDEKTCAAIDAFIGELDGMDGIAEEAEENAEGKKGAGGNDKKGIDKKAMDAAIEAAVAKTRTEAREAGEARDFVEPWIGKVGMAMDSAVEIYASALDALKVDVTDVPKSPAAYKAILKAQPKPGEGRHTLALDALETVDGSATHSRFASLDRIAG